MQYARYAAIKSLRARLQQGQVSIGSWMQLSHTAIAEIMGSAMQTVISSLGFSSHMLVVCRKNN